MPTVDVSNWQSQLRKGLLDMVILNLLQHRKCHGYEMVQALKKIEGLQIREGNIYPILARLEMDALLSSSRQASAEGPPREHSRDNKAWPQFYGRNEPALGSDERKHSEDKGGEPLMTEAEKTWISARNNYLQEVKEALKAAKYPGTKSIIEEVRHHLESRYSDLPAESTGAAPGKLISGLSPKWALPRTT